jgi:hypothetical protein
MRRDGRHIRWRHIAPLLRRSRQGQQLHRLVHQITSRLCDSAARAVGVRPDEALAGKVMARGTVVVWTSCTLRLAKVPAATVTDDTIWCAASNAATRFTAP